MLWAWGQGWLCLWVQEIHPLGGSVFPDVVGGGFHRTHFLTKGSVMLVPTAGIWWQVLPTGPEPAKLWPLCRQEATETAL